MRALSLHLQAAGEGAASRQPTSTSMSQLGLAALRPSMLRVSSNDDLSSLAATPPARGSGGGSDGSNTSMRALLHGGGHPLSSSMSSPTGARRQRSVRKSVSFSLAPLPEAGEPHIWRAGSSPMLMGDADSALGELSGELEVLLHVHGAWFSARVMQTAGGAHACAPFTQSCCCLLSTAGRSGWRPAAAAPAAGEPHRRPLPRSAQQLVGQTAQGAGGGTAAVVCKRRRQQQQRRRVVTNIAVC